MSRNHAHHDRGPPITDDLTVAADQVQIWSDLVVVAPDDVIIEADMVVVYPDKVVIAPDLVRCDQLPPRRHRRR